MGRDSDREWLDKWLAESKRREAERYQDLCVIWRRESTKEELLRVGGRWDALEQRYVGPAEFARIIDLKESQIQAARLAAHWIRQKQAGEKCDFFGLFLIGDRGGGKTAFAVILIQTLLVAFPKMGDTPALAWQVSNAHSERDELDGYIKQFFPGQWYDYREWPQHVYRWVTGGKSFNVSADSPDSLKRGRVDFELFNEPQKFQGRALAMGLPRLADRGGLTVFAANPPDQFRGKWIVDLWKRFKERKTEGRPFGIHFVEMNSADNDSKDMHVAQQIREVVEIIDPRLARADLDGKMLEVGRPCYWEWSRSRNIRKTPDLGDITREFTRYKTGRAYDFLIGADFQATPHMAAAVLKMYGTIEEPILFVVNDFVIDQASEDDLIDAIEDDEMGLTPENALVIGDCSGLWQDGKHSRNGRDSFAVFKARRWHIVTPTKAKDPKRHPKNPPVDQRLRLTNKLLQSEQLFVMPHCDKLQFALNECQLVQVGLRVKPDRLYSHITDALGYAVWWCFPKPSFPRSAGDSAGTSVDLLRN